MEKRDIINAAIFIILAVVSYILSGLWDSVLIRIISILLMWIGLAILAFAYGKEK